MSPNFVNKKIDFNTVLQFVMLFPSRSRDRSVGKATGWTDGVQFSVRASIYFLLRVQTGSAAYPASYPKDTRGSSPGGVKLAIYLHLEQRSSMGNNAYNVPHAFNMGCFIN
jgi:hypothetical protein